MPRDRWRVCTLPGMPKTHSSHADSPQEVEYAVLPAAPDGAPSE